MSRRSVARYDKAGRLAATWQKLSAETNPETPKVFKSWLRDYALI